MLRRTRALLVVSALAFVISACAEQKGRKKGTSRKSAERGVKVQAEKSDKGEAPGEGAPAEDQD